MRSRQRHLNRRKRDALDKIIELKGTFDTRHPTLSIVSNIKSWLSFVDYTAHRMNLRTN
jgi:hypothetical protein